MNTLRLSKIIKSYIVLFMMLFATNTYAQKENSLANQGDGKLANGKTIQQAIEERGIWKDKDSVKVGIGSLTKPPIFPGCRKKLSNKKQVQCFREKLRKYLTTRFRISKFKNGPKGLHKVICLFKISKEGSIIDIETFSKYKKDEVEAYRVITSLPKMIPGQLNGIPVTFKYVTPISFHIK